MLDFQKEREAFELWAIKASGGWASFSKSHGDVYANNKLQFAWETWLAAKAQVPEGFVLVPQASLKVALSWMDEDIDPWQMGTDSFADLHEHKPILETALVEAQEQGHE